MELPQFPTDVQVEDLAQEIYHLVWRAVSNELYPVLVPRWDAVEPLMGTRFRSHARAMLISVDQSLLSGDLT